MRTSQTRSVLFTGAPGSSSQRCKTARRIEGLSAGIGSSLCGGRASVEHARGWLQPLATKLLPCGGISVEHTRRWPRPLAANLLPSASIDDGRKTTFDVVNK